MNAQEQTAREAETSRKRVSRAAIEAALTTQDFEIVEMTKDE